MSILRQYLAVSLFFGCAMVTTGVSAAQPVPIPGVTGTIALPANVDKFYSDLNRLLVQAAEGIDHVVGETDGREHGESASLDSLRPGTPVLVHYTIEGVQTSAHEFDRTGPGRLKPNEGIVTTVEKKRVTIRFSDGATQTLRYTSHATKSSDGHVRHGNRVIVYSSDESGQRQTHYFKPGIR
jgi:hypothetical protein